MLNNSSKLRISPANSGNQSGFTLLETIVAILILTIALMGTAAALTYAFEYGTTSRNVGSCRMIIVSTMEEIESLRNSRRLEYKQIGNVGAVDNTGANNTFTGFSVDYQPVSMKPGFDGVYGTADDIKDAGVDGVLGTADDVDDPSLIRGGFMRKITITPLPLDPTIKRVEVNVKYFSAGDRVSVISGVGYINDEARMTY